LIDLLKADEKKMKKVAHLVSVIAIFTLMICSCSFQYEAKPNLFGKYLGMDVPGNNPELFAPKVVSTYF
jgi:hypothetical protein